MSALIRGLTSDAFLPYDWALSKMTPGERKVLSTGNIDIKLQYLEFALKNLPDPGIRHWHTATLVLIYKNLIESGADMAGVDNLIDLYRRRNYDIKTLIKCALKGYSIAKHSVSPACTTSHSSLDPQPKLASLKPRESTCPFTEVLSTCFQAFPELLTESMSAQKEFLNMCINSVVQTNSCGSSATS